MNAFVCRFIVINFMLYLMCVSCIGNKLLKSAQEQQSIGNNFRAATIILQRLDEKPKDKKSLEILSQVAKPGYQEQLSTAEENEQKKQYDAALSEYRVLDQYYKKLNTFGIELQHVDIERRTEVIKNTVAEEYYQKGQQQFTSGDYQDAIRSYKKARLYKDNYKDSTKKIAQSYYERGVSLAGQERLREAVKEFRKTLTFMSKFRDAKELADKYEKIANEQDAKTHYERGMSLMNQYKFKEAEAEFSKVNEYVRGYKDALQLQTRCKEAIPNDKQIILAIARCLQSEIPVSWVGNLLGGRNARVSTVRVQKIGIYNERYGYWPMKIRVAGTCALNDPFNQGKTVRFDRVSDFLLYRDDYGEWQARLRGGMFQ